MFSPARIALRSTAPGLVLRRGLSSSAATKRTALITGSGRGIGRAIALRLASDGFDICVNDLPSNAESIESVAKEVRALGREAFTTFCDVTKISQVEETVQKSVDALGPLNVMVANAGIVQIESLMDTTLEQMQQIYEINVFGVVYSNAIAGKQFIKQGTGGKIINAARFVTDFPLSSFKATPKRLEYSIASFRGNPPLALYCSTKAAVRSLTQGFAQELGPHKVTVNAYAPGNIDTPMWEKIDIALGKLSGMQVGESWKSMEAITPLRRNGSAEDVSRLVSFLAGPDSDFITGQTMIVDGGIMFS
ncbi:hypothetical protein V5O48_008536 [Marasmius crinis-equi]|uniref:Uncharacterized protein n=1 Tax=Marasmius crinis-equi TaxID=585013 RepID=A0ABR3FE63_9AGAR